MHETFRRWWDLLVDADAADAGQRVGRPQFLAVMRSHVTHPEHFPDVVLPIADALMRALDTDGSGTLSADEYVRMYDALGIPRPPPPRPSSGSTATTMAPSAMLSSVPPLRSSI